ncbi:hypothetical protein [Cerasicoccus fimbriatus]|uniref:hypothetical protein n=1 Tax=Cerasicoccus fimbriatus TaxID=3014554 RepID=UPI0022B5DC44|nr:hypothetical protein [Cerasicoccus sp. TK19100]
MALPSISSIWAIAEAPAANGKAKNAFDSVLRCVEVEREDWGRFGVGVHWAKFLVFVRLADFSFKNVNQTLVFARIPFGDSDF